MSELVKVTYGIGSGIGRRIIFFFFFFGFKARRRGRTFFNFLSKIFFLILPSHGFTYSEMRIIFRKMMARKKKAVFWLVLRAMVMVKGNEVSLAKETQFFTLGSETNQQSRKEERLREFVSNSLVQWREERLVVSRDHYFYSWEEENGKLLSFLLSVILIHFYMNPSFSSGEGGEGREVSRERKGRRKGKERRRKECESEKVNKSWGSWEEEEEIHEKMRDFKVVVQSVQISPISGRGKRTRLPSPSFFGRDEMKWKVFHWIRRERERDGLLLLVGPVPFSASLLLPSHPSPKLIISSRSYQRKRSVYVFHVCIRCMYFHSHSIFSCRSFLWGEGEVSLFLITSIFSLPPANIFPLFFLSNFDQFFLPSNNRHLHLCIIKESSPTATYCRQMCLQKRRIKWRRKENEGDNKKPRIEFKTVGCFTVIGLFFSTWRLIRVTERTKCTCSP